MIDMTESEAKALEAASDQAGEYLEEMKQTDLQKLSREQWMGLIECVVTAFTDRLRELESAASSRI